MEKVGKTWTNTSYEATSTLVYNFGAGLQALGVKKGENIALLSEGRNLWIISELALFYAGGVTVPLSIKLEESNDLLFRLQHGECRYVIVSGNQLPKIRKIKEQLTEVRHIIVLDPQPSYEEGEIFVGDVMQRGESRIEEIGLDAFKQVGLSIQNDDLATITYTSGTTADPKGVCLTHRNYTANTVKDGWLYTGDLGYMSAEGLLYVKGRFKSLLISSDGEKYSPEGIEEAIVQLCPAIEQVMLYNNQSPTTAALIVPNKDYLRRLGFDLKSQEGARAALEELMKELATFRKNGEHAGMFPDRWLPTVLTVLPEPFSEQNHQINSTMRMVRPAIEKAYATRIANMYTPEGKNLHNEDNLAAMMG